MDRLESGDGFSTAVACCDCSMMAVVAGDDMAPQSQSSVRCHGDLTSFSGDLCCVLGERVRRVRDKASRHLLSRQRRRAG